MRRCPAFARLLLLSLLTALLHIAPVRPAGAWFDRTDDHWPREFHHDERWRHDHPHGLLFPPIVVSPLGGPPTVPAPAGYWYRCDNPAGYYPLVGNCLSRWRVVAAQPIK
jgi:hypothetical protein